MQPEEARFDLRCQIPQRYQLIEVLGEGSFGKVWLAQDNLHNRPVAAKVIPIDPKLNWRYAIREIANQQGHTCPQIIKFIEVIRTDNFICIIMEYAPGGDLNSYLHDEGGVFYEKLARWYFQQIICALFYLHTNDVVMRDVKLENVVLDEGHTIAKLCDYGFSKRISGNGPCTYVGSPPFMAPELITASRVSGGINIGKYDGKAVDVWAAGVCLYKMIYGRYPFENPDDVGPGSTQRMLNNIERSHIHIPYYQKYNHQDKRVTDGARKLLERIFVKNPAARITIDQIIRTEWFQEDLPQQAIESLRNYEVPTSLGGVQHALSPAEIWRKLRFATVDPLDPSTSWFAAIREWMGR